MSAEPTFDYAVIGAGIAGASVAHRLCADRRGSVIVLERESQPGYHTTGRSAAMFIETYGTAAVRALTRASREFFLHPPAGFAEHPILAPRAAMHIAAVTQKGLLDELFADLSANAAGIRRIGTADAISRVPVLREASAWGAILDPDAQDIDVHALHQGYLRGARAGGAVLCTDAELVGAERRGDVWRLTLGRGETLRARVVVDAAGAWADVVAALCGARPVGLEPRRRTAFTFAAPPGVDCTRWPVVVAVDESFYFKPDAGRLLGTPANADPVPPHDVRPEELDVAIGIDRIQQATTLTIDRPLHTWAGLRSFVRDGELVVGWDDGCAGFFWLAAQGGYGIQTSAAVADLAAALLGGAALPPHLTREGVDPAVMAPSRLR